MIVLRNLQNKMKANNIKEWHHLIRQREDYTCQICKRQFPENELCGHHLLRKGNHPHLKLETDNGICVDMQCHNKLHSGEIKYEDT